MDDAAAIDHDGAFGRLVEKLEAASFVYAYLHLLQRVVAGEVERVGQATVGKRGKLDAVPCHFHTVFLPLPFHVGTQPVLFTVHGGGIEVHS